MRAAQYAQALSKAARGNSGEELDALVRTFAETLARHGHEKLLPRIVREYEKLETRTARGAGARIAVAHTRDAETHHTAIVADLRTLGGGDIATAYRVVDSTLVGGYEVRAGGTSIDRTHKRALLALYEHLRRPLSSSLTATP